jgi:hypothetical protein
MSVVWPESARSRPAELRTESDPRPGPLFLFFFQRQLARQGDTQ